MTFRAGETKTLHVGYIIPVSFAGSTTRKPDDLPVSIAGKLNDAEKFLFHDPLNPPEYEKPWHARVEACEVVYFSYITETGKSWAGPIEKATFRVRNHIFEYGLRKFPEFVGGNPADLPASVEIPEEATMGGSIFGMKLGTLYSQISPEGWKSAYIPEIPPGEPKPGYEPDGIAWKFENYKPGPPLSFTYYLTGFPETAADCDAWVRQVLGKNPSKADVLELREIAAAFFGVAPQTGSVKRFAEQQVWYNRQSKVSESELSEPRRAVLVRLTTIAKDKPDAPASSIPAVSPLIAQEPKLRATLKGHIYQVTAVAFSPDGKTLASASCDQRIKLWDAATGKNTATLKGHTNAVLAVAFSRDGKTLASADWNGTIKFWDVASNKNTATIDGHKDRVETVAFSPNGNILVSGGSDTAIKLWDVATAKNIITLSENVAVVTSVAFSPDGKTVAAGGYDNTVRLWDAATGKEIAAFKGHTDVIFSVAFSPDGKTLASASGDMTIKLWDVASGKNTTTLNDTHGVLSVTFSPDGKTLASGSQGETIKLWDVAAGKNIATLGKHISQVTSVAFSPDSKTLASSGNLRSLALSLDTGVSTVTDIAGILNNNTIKLWDVPEGNEANK